MNLTRRGFLGTSLLGVAVGSVLISSGLKKPKTLYWIGGEGSWSDAKNWAAIENGQASCWIPDKDIAVKINKSGMVTINRKADAKSVDMNDGSLTLNADLTVHGNLNCTGKNNSINDPLPIWF
jgi:hypothetical protein